MQPWNTSSSYPCAPSSNVLSTVAGSWSYPDVQNFQASVTRRGVSHNPSLESEFLPRAVSIVSISLRNPVGCCSIGRICVSRAVFAGGTRQRGRLGSRSCDDPCRPRWSPNELEIDFDHTRVLDNAERIPETRSN